MKRQFWLIGILSWLGVAMLLPWFQPVLADGEYKVQVVQVQTSAYPEITVYVEVTDTTGQPVTELQQADFTITEDGQPVELTGFAGVGEKRPVDIVFVFDTTGSMGEEIEGVKDTCIHFAEELEAKGRDYRLGLVTFWDEVQGVYRSGGQLTDNVQEFKSWIEAIWTTTGAGGDEPENSFGALKEASKMTFRPEAQRIFILITDAPAHYYGDEGLIWGTYDDPDLDPDRILNILAKQTVTVYSVAFDHPDFRRLAGETGGKFYDINREPNFIGIIEEIGGNIATQYRLTYHSPRPTYDGTRRDIQVTVKGGASGSGGTGGSVYLEQHLLNIQSNLLVGMICLPLLLLLLAAPAGLRLVNGGKVPPSSDASISPPFPPSPPAWVPPPSSPTPLWAPPQPSPPSTPSFDLITCPHCGHSLRPGAKFCPGCGRSPASPTQPATVICPNCGQPIRSGARFCGRCGYKKQ